MTEAERARERWPDLLAGYAAEGREAVARLSPRLDIPYGPHPRQRMDLFAAVGSSRGTFAFFHAGFWQSRDKADFHFLAAGLVAAGIGVAFVNYPLCPETPLRGVVAAAAAAVEPLAGLAPGPLVLAGHSAGGHLVVELALLDLLRRRPLASGVLAISGVFNLAALVGTPVNDRLGLTPEEARALSPLGRLRPGLPPAAFVVGGLETPQFLADTDAAGAAWRAAGAPASVAMLPGEDHFSLLRGLTVPGTPLWSAATGLFPGPGQSPEAVTEGS